MTLLKEKLGSHRYYFHRSSLYCWSSAVFEIRRAIGRLGGIYHSSIKLQYVIEVWDWSPIEAIVDAQNNWVQLRVPRSIYSDSYPVRQSTLTTLSSLITRISTSDLLHVSILTHYKESWSKISESVGPATSLGELQGTNLLRTCTLWVCSI